MLNKILHISISLLLVTATTGVTISKHYSGGKPYSFSITGKAQSCCETDCDCCKNSADTFRLTADFLATTNTYHNDEPFTELCDIFYIAEQNLYHTCKYQSLLKVYYQLPLSDPDIRAQIQSFLL